MAFFNSAVTVLQTLVIALGAGLGIWGAINLLEGYGNDNPGAKVQRLRRIAVLFYRGEFQPKHHEHKVVASAAVLVSKGSETPVLHTLP